MPKTPDQSMTDMLAAAQKSGLCAACLLTATEMAYAAIRNYVDNHPHSCVGEELIIHADDLMTLMTLSIAVGKCDRNG